MTSPSPSGPVAVVTGGLRGIGAASCDALRAAGYRSVCIDRDADPALPLQYACDVADVPALVAVLERIEAELGPIEVLVNNAGMLQMQTLFDLTPEAFDRTMDVNLRSMMFASQHVARRMLALGLKGRIVNVASSAGRYGSSYVDYAASKGGVIALTLSFAKVLAPDGIRVNAVAPGQVITDLHHAMPAAQQAANAARIGLKRPAVPAEIAEVIAFLAGSASSFMTGSVVDANGGRF